MTTKLNISRKCIAFITGASKGIGRTIAIELSRKCSSASIIVLLARSEEGLEETKRCIVQVNQDVIVMKYKTDLSKPDLRVYEGMFDEILASIGTEAIDFGIIFHNAGHVGTLRKASELSDLQTWREYYDLNMFSMVLLNNVFIKRIKCLTSKLFIINITSLVGQKPFENLAMYGSGKAAREIFFKVLALEEPDIVVLNYSPGPVQTDMFSSICNEAESEMIRENFKKTNALTTDETVHKMFNILEKCEFNSGDTVDYYDA